MHLEYGIGGKVVVIGDVMLDRYVYGEASRLSPEAPVPVVLVNRKTATLGGAGNVALNLKRLDCKVWLFGSVGNDRHGRRVGEILARERINNCLLVDEKLPTTTKTRLMANNQQIVRFDEEGNDFNTQSIKITSKLFKIIDDHQIEAVVISDYNKGFLCSSLIKNSINVCREKSIPILVDPKHGSWDVYHGATLIKPNLQELRDVGGAWRVEKAGVLNVANDLLNLHELEAVIVTLGSGGMLLVSRDHSEAIPTHAKEVFDVSGAGDTVISVLAACLCRGYNYLDAARIANVAAGIVVGKLGTQPVTVNELLEATT